MNYKKKINPNKKKRFYAMKNKKNLEVLKLQEINKTLSDRIQNLEHELLIIKNNQINLHSEWGKDANADLINQQKEVKEIKVINEQLLLNEFNLQTEIKALKKYIQSFDDETNINHTKKENDDLKKQVDELKIKESLCQVQLNKLKQEFNNVANNEFLKKVNEKAEQAEKILKQKVQTYQEKFDLQLTQAKKYALEKHAAQLVDIIGQFESALAFSPKDSSVQNYLMGFNMFLNMFQQLLQNLHINKINVKVNDEFNSEFMEAFESISVGVELENKVLAVVSPGYQLHDRVIKHVLVKVGVKQ